MSGSAAEPPSRRAVPPSGPAPELARRIGRWALTGLVINGIVGSAIFGLPATVGERLGRGAPLAWALAAVLIGIVVACFAEVASRFREAGGPYLFVQASFGRFAGLQTGWMAYLTRLTAAGAVANLLVSYLGVIVPGADAVPGRYVVLAAVIGGLAAVNYRGVGPGAGVSSAFAILKLLGLFVFAGAGLLWLLGHEGIPAPAAPPGIDPWLATLLVLVFAYGGFEAALMPLAEAKNPERDAPVALFTALATATLVYMLVQTVVTLTLPNPGATTTPLADAARGFLGTGGAMFIAATALLSTFGYLAGAMVNVPRLTFAMAERAELPRGFAAVHRRFRTPFVSILVFAGLAFVLAASGSFLQNVSLSVAARLITYGLVCAALPALRRRDGTARTASPAAFRLPGGPVLAGLGVLGMALMAVQVSAREVVIMGVVIVLASVHYFVVSRRAD
ncbi:MAG: APC family permease [Gemmatimonadales bacterium]